MSKIRASARGEECLVRLEGICNGNPETTILAHLNGAGMGTKHIDIFGAYCCSSCHTVLDKLPTVNHCTSFDDAITLLKFHEGVFRTQKRLLEKGLITIKGMIGFKIK